MVYVEIAGRCGNQLFHYAVARYIQLKTNDKELCINFKKVFEKHKESEGWYDVLAEYNVVPYKYYSKKGTVLKNETNIIQKVMVMLKAFHIRINSHKSRQEQAEKAIVGQKLLNFFGIYWVREGVNKIWVYKRKKSIISGVCEASFIYEISDTLRVELQPKAQIMPENIQLIKDIQEQESVCISVRRGDFFNSTNVESFAVCNENYYSKAKQIIDAKVADAKYFVFSDDIDWCMNNLNFEGNVTYVNQNMPVYETLRLMYSCKHFILSNSTFSWWGQFLSKNQNKVVVSPTRWNNDGYNTVLIGKDWIEVEA